MATSGQLQTHALRQILLYSIISPARGKERQGHVPTERLGRLEVDEQLELGGLRHGKLG